MKTKDALAQVNLDFSNEDAGWRVRHSGRSRGRRLHTVDELGRFKEGDCLCCFCNFGWVLLAERHL